jgi:hypothetical protein
MQMLVRQSKCFQGAIQISLPLFVQIKKFNLNCKLYDAEMTNKKLYY